MRNVGFGIALLVLAGRAECVAAQGASVADAVPPAYRAELRQSRVVSVIHERDDTALSLLPACVYEADVRAETLEKDAKNVPFVAEFLYEIPKADLSRRADGREPTTDDVSVVLRSISTMAGMRYRVTKRNPDGELLYKKAYMIAAPGSAVPILDQNAGSADGQLSYCYLYDCTYGETTYTLRYRQQDGVLYASFLLISPLTFMGIRAVMPGKMRITVVALDCGDDLLLYLSVDVDARNLALVDMRKQVRDSMVARMEAVYRWFLAQF
ncbi:MAG: hypothetical protein J1E32_03380 [Treponema sp.]|nr:hypothetical protein [Treponema sp.]